MNLVTTTNSQRIAAEVESITKETISFVAARLNQIYSLVNTPGEEANILAAFGTNGVAALQAYGAFQAASAAVGVSVPAPDLERFVPQEDGTVSFVPPAEPEELEQGGDGLS